MDQPNLQDYLLEQKGHILYVTVNRPKVHNAMRVHGWVELGEIVNYAEQEDSIRVVIITGAGEKAFVSGADISEFGGRTPVDNLQNPGRPALNNMEDSRKIYIAAVNGYAFGGGFELALACDIRICSDNAQFALPETGIGVIPGLGGTQRLPRIVGVGRTKEIALAGKRVKADEALNMGLVMSVVPQAELAAEADRVAGEILGRSPVANAITKKAINMSLFTDPATGLIVEGLGFSVATTSEDRLEGTASFMEKRKPNFPGR